MSDVRFDLKPVPKRPSRKYRINIKNGSFTKITDYEKDSKVFLSDYEYQPALTDKLDKLDEETFNQELLNEILLWKVNRYATFDKEILDQIDSVKDYKLGEHRKGMNVLHGLLKIKGVDIAMASTILRFRNPEVYQIIDRHAYRAVYGSKYPLYPSSSPYQKVDLYFDYLDELITIAEEKGIEFKTIDRLLYEFDKQLNGKL